MTDRMIAAYGGQSVGSAMINRIVEQEIRRREAMDIEARREEIEALRAQVAIRQERDRAYYSRMIRRARRLYGDNPHYGPIRRLAWGLYGLVIESLMRPLEHPEEWDARRGRRG